MQNAQTELSTTLVESALELSDGMDLQQHSSRLMTVLETAWRELRGIIPGLPPVVLVVLSAREYSRRGRFAMESWRKRHEESLLHEVAVHPGMFESPDDLLVTLLHEAAHAILWECRKVADKHCCGVSLRGYYHRKEFRVAARALGLEAHFLNRRYGFCVTTWQKVGVPGEYGAVLGTLSKFAVSASKQLPPRVAPVVPKKQVPLVVLRCACSPPRLVRTQRAELQRGGIICAWCGVAFFPDARCAVEA